MHALKLELKRSPYRKNIFSYTIVLNIYTKAPM